MSIVDIVERTAEGAVDWVKEFGGQAAEQLGFIEGMAPNLLELGFRLLMHEIEGDDESGGGHVTTPNTNVDSAQLIQAEIYSHAYGGTDDIITVPDAVTANLARAFTTVDADNRADAWSLAVDSLGPVEDNPTTFAEGTLPVQDAVTTFSDDVPTEPTLAPDPFAADTLVFTVHEATTTVWTSALH